MEQGRKHVILALLTTLIIAPTLTLGAAHPQTLAIFLVLTSALFIYLSVSRRIGRIRLDLPSIVLLGLICFTFFQIIPLPAILLKIVSPMAHEVRSRALIPLGAPPPSFMPISLDVPFTAIELGKLFLYTAIYWTSLLWTRKHGAKPILTIIIASGVIGAGVFLAHKILILDKVYGFYTPSHLSFGQDGSTAPLINENHMAAFLALCSAITIGRALAARDRSRRLVLVALASIMGGALVLTLSRGGITAFLCGQVLFITLRLIHRFKSKNKNLRHISVAWLPMGLAASFGLALMVAQDAIYGEFVQGNASKLDLFFEGIPLIGEFFAVGVGRGAFWVGFPLVSEIGVEATFTHAENAVIQILADYGIFVGGAALVLFAIFIGKRLLKAPSRADICAVLCALVAFGVHNLVDFNMEIPGVAVLAAVLLGVLSGRRRNSQERKSKETREERIISTPILRTMGAATLLLSLAIGLYFSSRTVGAEETRYRQAFAGRDFEPFSKDALRDVLKRHPASWYFPFVVGVWNYHIVNENPMPWLARAIELNPAAAAARFYVGQTFLKVGKLDQALLEFRLATNLDPDLAHSAAKSLVSKIPQFSSLASIAVNRDEKIKLWGSLSTALQSRGHDGESEKADLAILELHPSDPRALARHAMRLAKRNRTDEAFELALRLSKLPKFVTAGAKLMAHIHQQIEEHTEAVAVLLSAAKIAPRDIGLLRSLVWAKQRAGDIDGALATANRIRTVTSDIEGQADVAVLVADIALSAGRRQSALASLSKAHSLSPSNTAILLKIANIAESTNDKTRLIESLQKIMAIDPTNQATRNRLMKIEKEETRQKLLVE